MIYLRSILDTEFDFLKFINNMNLQEITLSLKLIFYFIY